MLHTEDKAYRRLIHAEWAPRGHALVLIHEYDIYYKPNPRDNATYRVTRDALPGQIYNGVPDWLYEGIHDYKYFSIFRNSIYHRRRAVGVTSIFATLDANVKGFYS